MGLLVVQSRVQADKRSTVGANIVLVGAELTTFSGNSLELFLSWSIGIANVHWKTFFANADAVELSNDLVADLARVKSRLCQEAKEIVTPDRSSKKPTEQSQRHGCSPCYREESCWTECGIQGRWWQVPRAGSATQAAREKTCKSTYHLVQALGQVGDVEVS